MRTNQEHQKVLEYHDKGLTQTEISKLIKIPRSTIKDWVNKPIPQTKDFNPKQYIIENNLQNEYSYILGLYLGDGYINQMPRTWKLRFFLDANYQNLNDYIVNQTVKIFPQNKVNPHRHPKLNMITIYVHSKTIPLLFPQHGKGMKHTRKIKLVNWQNEIIKSKHFVKGLFHSDGSCYPRTNKKTGKIYYSYDFRNESDDLHNLFQKHCKNLNIYCTFSRKPKTTHIYKRSEVNKMMGLVGTKENIRE